MLSPIGQRLWGHEDEDCVIRRLADGTVEIRYEAPSSANVPKEIAALVKAGKTEHRGSKKTGGYHLVEGKVKPIALCEYCPNENCG